MALSRSLMSGSTSLLVEFIKQSIFAKQIARIEIEHALALALGLLLCLEEANMALRVLLKALDVNPPAKEKDPAEPPDAGAYLRGGLIGSIERLGDICLRRALRLQCNQFCDCRQGNCTFQ